MLPSLLMMGFSAARAAKERRRYHRFPLNIPVDVKLLDDTGIPEGVVINASQMGLLIQSSRDMPIGKRIDLEVSLTKNRGSEKFRTRAEIVWKEKKRFDEAEGFQYGVKLIEVLNEGHAKLESLLHE